MVANLIFLSSKTPIRNGSAKVMWLGTTISGPVWGMFSRPFTFKRVQRKKNVLKTALVK